MLAMIVKTGSSACPDQTYSRDINKTRNVGSSEDDVSSAGKCIDHAVTVQVQTGCLSGCFCPISVRVQAQ